MRRQFEGQLGTMRLTGLIVVWLGLSGLVPAGPALAQTMSEFAQRASELSS